MLRKFLQLLTILSVVFMGTNAKAEEQQYDPDNVLYMQLKDGVVKIALMPELAPNHVAKIKKLVRRKFYDGLKFHRVIDGFMVQTGDPKGNGTGGSGENINAEISQEKHVRGIVSMARAVDLNSADSQFFIMLGDAPSLDGQYTVFGKVISGMEYVDKIKKGDLSKNGAVINPDKMISVRVESDLIKSGLLKK